MSTTTTLVCGLGDRDVVTITEENGERRVTDLTGAPLVAFEQHAGTATIDKAAVTIEFGISDNLGTIGRGSQFRLYLRAGPGIKQAGFFFEGTVLRRHIGQLV